MDFFNDVFSPTGLRHLGGLYFPASKRHPCFGSLVVLYENLFPLSGVSLSDVQDSLSHLFTLNFSDIQ